MSPIIKMLSAITTDDTTFVGGKGANLGRLFAAGFSVPLGFCVTTPVYQHLLRQSAVHDQIAAKLAETDLSVFDNIRACGAVIRELIMAQALPDDLTAAILSAYHDLHALSGSYVAVRSSATAEDLPDLSFAGQHDTYLNVSGEIDLLFSIKRCWASLWSDRAIAYRHTHHIDHLKVLMAVVVQQMMPATVSGVLFTANPVTQRRDECLINAHWGLGEVIVSGMVSPDEFVVAKDTLTVTRQTIMEKTVMVTLGAKGAVEVPVPAIQQTQPCLTEAQICELIGVGKQIEECFGAPQDIEWAFADHRLVILQARPITTLQAPPAAAPVIWFDPRAQELLRGKVVFWSNFNTGEMMPYPLTPLSWSYFAEVIFPGMFKQFFGLTPDDPLYPYYSNMIDLVYGRVYWNINMLFGNPMLGAIFRKNLHTIDQKAGEMLNTLMQQGELHPVKTPVRLKYLWSALLQSLRLFGALLLTPKLFTPEVVAQRARKYWDEALAFEQADLKTLSDADLLRQVKTFSEYSANFWSFAFLLIGYAVFGYEILRWLVRTWPDVPADKLLAGIPGTKTTEGALALYQLADMPDTLKQRFLACPLRDIPAMLQESADGRAFAQRFEAFLAQFGHRGPREFDIGQPRSSEDPSFVFQMIKNYLQVEQQDTTPLAHFQQMAAERERVTELIRQRLRQSGWGRILPVKRWLFEFALKHAQNYMPWRENPKYYVLKAFAAARKYVLELGWRWRKRGWLTTPDEIFFFSVSELERICVQTVPDHSALHAQIQQRKAKWEANLKLAPPFIVRSDGKPVTLLHPESQATDDILRGTAASSGKARGKARVILDPADGCAFDKGEILVAPFTDPGWTPLFLTAKAVVMEVGGVMCHGAVVAREYSIPAVVGVKHATELIRTGDEIIVDGDEGRVILVKATQERK